MKTPQTHLRNLREAMAVRSQREVAAMLGCSFQAVQQCEARAFRKLRNSSRVRTLWRALQTTA